MSYSSDRRKALDPEFPFRHRASHARSCALLVAQKFRVSRSVVLDKVFTECGVNLLEPQEPSNLEKAIEVIDRLRFEGVEDATKDE